MPEPKWSGRNPTPDGGTTGPMSLTDLSDVTGTPGPNLSPVYDQHTGIAPLTEVTTRADLDQILAQVAAINWTVPTLQSQFRNIGDPWAPCRYRLLANSTVRVQGTVTSDDQTISDATWIPIFNVEPQAAPGVMLEYAVLTNDNAMSKVLVTADGQVIWGGYAVGPHAPIGRLGGGCFGHCEHLER